jgi:hypothetical protein
VSEFPQDRFLRVPPEIKEPTPWRFDGDIKRRVPVLDEIGVTPRIVRYVGYRACLRCRRPFFTPDVVKVRLCTPCKTPNSVDDTDEARARRSEYDKRYRKRIKEVSPAVD